MGLVETLTASGGDKSFPRGSGGNMLSGEQNRVEYRFHPLSLVSCKVSHLLTVLMHRSHCRRCSQNFA